MELNDISVGDTVWIAVNRQWKQEYGDKGVWIPIEPTLCKGVVRKVDTSKYQPEVTVDWDEQSNGVVPNKVHPSQLSSYARHAIFNLLLDVRHDLVQQAEGNYGEHLFVGSMPLTAIL